jgi:hypothetical protein
MTMRLVVDGRGPLRRAILDRMVAAAGGRVEVATLYDDRTGDFHAPCLHRMEVRNGKRGHLMAQHLGRGANLPLIASPDFARIAEQAVDQMHRMAPTYRYRSHHMVNLQDYLDYFHILADAMAQEMTASGATHAVFLNMPHLAYDVVLYDVARALGLPTLILCQTIFPNRYFSMPRIEDMGTLIDDGRSVEPMPIDRGTEPNLFYMDPRWQKPGPRGRLTARAVWNLIRHVAVREPGALLRPGYLLSTLRRMAAIYESLPDWRDPFAAFFHTNELAYFEHLAEHEGRPVDLNLPFVYVPLHNQPEMSTSSLGGAFRDQLLMVEALAADLPEGWRIYVKENPRQGSFARGPMFFHRLTRLRGVQFVPSDTSTHELSSRARFTASVVGTAGWEAVRKGRPTMVFGNPWYKSLPGVVPWRAGLDFAAVAATRIDHAALEEQAGRIVARCHPGVIETIYEKLVPDLDREANAAQVAADLLALLEGRERTTFGAFAP